MRGLAGRISTWAGDCDDVRRLRRVTGVGVEARVIVRDKHTGHKDTENIDQNTVEDAIGGF